MTTSAKTLKTKLAWGFVIACVIIALAYALKPKPEAVNLTTVERGYFAETVREEGRTHLQDTYTVAVPIQGFLQRVALNVGDPVNAGQALFHIEPLPTPALDARSREQAREALVAARSRVAAAEAELENRHADLEFSRNELNRFRQLANEGVISTTELERVATQVQRAEAAERGARASLGAAQAELENARIVLAITEGTRTSADHQALAIPAPISGVVLRRFRCCEGVVNAGDAILELGNLEQLEVRIDLLSQEAVRVAPGMRVEIDRWGGDESLHARIRLVDPAGFTKVSALGIDEQRVAAYATLESPPEQWQRLGEGFRVEAAIITWEADDVLYLPVSALFRVADQWHVFRVNNQRAELVAVEVGRRSGIHAQIIRGVAAGDVIINHPPAHLQAGTRVTSL
ncbi:efflux RND transporter periplasmic adaptor subunit [Aliidiomarina haloalkalitolerans]|uniref:Efflux transporter periplasmic adaptor subunit n=1 Tax=Aliidiomarina haloalkalitolerans TaxID=859059 RepID=A0A432VXP4_9GAMM|nr:HlyD family efflux transporter periplasmic adaptor subunit [Aliidiomarina haloalkalitolerans]RUO21471.1 efflux transporter periplasmic adaptor subunit [Aliidiomarina haloalkalitolerans]